MNPIAANLKVKAGRRQQPLKPGNNFHDKSIGQAEASADFCVRT
jgi:hypothetical protein